MKVTLNPLEINQESRTIHFGIIGGYKYLDHASITVTFTGTDIKNFARIKFNWDISDSITITPKQQQRVEMEIRSHLSGRNSRNPVETYADLVSYGVKIGELPHAYGVGTGASKIKTVIHVTESDLPKKFVPASPIVHAVNSIPVGTRYRVKKGTQVPGTILTARSIIKKNRLLSKQMLAILDSI